MSHTGAEDSAATPQLSGDEQQDRRRRFLPVWLWIALAGVLVVVFVIIAIQLFSGTTDDAAPTTSPSASSSPSASPTPSATVSPSPTVKDVGQGTFDSALLAFVTDAINSRNTGVFAESPTFSDPVQVLVANGGPIANMNPFDAVEAMDGFLLTPTDPNPWDFALPDSVLETYRSGPYGEYFPAGAIVARSHNGHVFSFIGHDTTITTMLMTSSEDALH